MTRFENEKTENNYGGGAFIWEQREPTKAADRPPLQSIPDGWIGSAIQYVYLRVPEIDVRLIVLRVFLLLALNLRHPFLLLIPHTGLIGRLATDQRRCNGCNRNELKGFHIPLSITRPSGRVTHHFS